MGEPTVEFANALKFPLSDPVDAGDRGAPALHRRPSRRSSSRTSTPRSTRRRRRPRSGTPSRRSVRGGKSCRRTEADPAGHSLAGLTAAIAAYTAGADHLWRAGLWPDVLFIALVLIPATLALVLLLLPLAFKPGSCRSPASRWSLSRCSGARRPRRPLQPGQAVRARSLGFWFLSFFENVAWAALVAVIIPWVDIWSRLLRPDRKITSDHPSVFEHISIAFRVPGGHSTANLGPTGHPLLRAVRRGGTHASGSGPAGRGSR